MERTIRFVLQAHPLQPLSGGLTGGATDRTIARVLIFLGLLTMQLSATTAPMVFKPGAYIITMGPGDAVWEKFGHNMLWIHDPDRGMDAAFNWGLFDFEQKNFIFNFLQGRLWYWMDGFDAWESLRGYLEDDRTIWIQELNLSQTQRQALWNLCVWNAQEQNKRYLYDYYRDNCSTRLRDAVDQVLGGQIRKQTGDMPSELTYRLETCRLMAGNPLLYTALYFILGQPVDRSLTVWDEMFIPMRMRQRLNQLTISNEAGQQIPLVRNEVLLHVSRRAPVRENPPNWTVWFMLAGVLIGGGQALLGDRACNSHPARWGFAAIAMPWSFVAGFAGWFLVYGWWFTDHVAVRGNENILQLSPLMFPLVVLLPLTLAGQIKAGRIALILAAMSFAASGLGLILKLLPAMNQTNTNMIALALPANAGLAWGLWRLITKRKEGC